MKKLLVLHSRDTVKQCLDLCKKCLRDPTTHKIHLHCFQGDAGDLAPYASMKNLKVGITNAVWSNSQVEATLSFTLSDYAICFVSPAQWLIKTMKYVPGVKQTLLSEAVSSAKHSFAQC